MKIYISVPISGRDLSEVEEQINEAQRGLALQGYETVSPLEVNNDYLFAPYSELLANDIKALLECDAIYLCKGWEKSKGCRAELFLANLYGLPVTTLKDEKTPYMNCSFGVKSTVQTKHQRDWGHYALLTLAIICLLANILILTIN